MQQQLSLAPFLFVPFLIFIALANVAYFKAQGEVNPLLPADQRISLWDWRPGKFRRLWKEHKRLCPTSRWRVWLALSNILAALFFIASIIYGR